MNKKHILWMVAIFLVALSVIIYTEVRTSYMPYHLAPATTGTYTMGTSSYLWDVGYFDSVYVSGGVSSVGGVSTEGAGNYETGEITLGKTEWDVGCLYKYFRNKTGATITKGEWVQVDNVGIEVVDTVVQSAAQETLTVAEGLGGEGGYFRIAVSGFSFADVCTVSLKGINRAGTATTETLSVGTGAGLQYTATVWDSVTEAIVWDFEANDSIFISAYSIGGVMDNTSNSTTVCGVVADASIADNAIGKFCIYGIIDYAIVTGSTAGIPGAFLEATGSNNLVDPNASLTATGSGCGILLEGCSGQDTVLAFVMHQ